MAREYKVNIKTEALAQASAEFYHFYGHAMARWASLERALFYWFAGITGMPNGMARAIFYGARGFGARADMLEASIQYATKQTAAEISFIKEALKKARTYSSFRNRIAHGEPQLNIAETHENTNLHYTLVQGKDVTSSNDPTISIEDLQTASHNIHRLQKYILEPLPMLRKPDSKSPEECLSLVLALPNQPNSKNDQTPSESGQSLQEPVHRDKKAHRAAQQAAKEPPDE